MRRILWRKDLHFHFFLQRLLALLKLAWFDICQIVRAGRLRTCCGGRLLIRLPDSGNNCAVMRNTMRRRIHNNRSDIKARSYLDIERCVFAQRTTQHE